MAGRSAKRKGTRVERDFVNKAKSQGLDSHRVPGSGAFIGLPGDIYIEGQRCECKARKNGFAMMERWLKGNDVLLLKPDFKPEMVVMWWDDWIQMLKELKEYREFLLGPISAVSTKEEAEEIKDLEGGFDGQDPTEQH